MESVLHTFFASLIFIAVFFFGETTSMDPILGPDVIFTPASKFSFPLVLEELKNSSDIIDITGNEIDIENGKRTAEGEFIHFQYAGLEKEDKNMKIAFMGKEIVGDATRFYIKGSTDTCFNNRTDPQCITRNFDLLFHLIFFETWEYSLDDYYVENKTIDSFCAKCENGNCPQMDIFFNGDNFESIKWNLTKCLPNEEFCYMSFSDFAGIRTINAMGCTSEGIEKQSPGKLEYDEEIDFNFNGKQICSGLLCNVKHLTKSAGSVEDLDFKAMVQIFRQLNSQNEKNLENIRKEFKQLQSQNEKNFETFNNKLDRFLNITDQKLE